MPQLKATVTIGETPQTKVYLAALDDGSSHITLSLDGETARFLSCDEARELAKHLNAAAEQLDGGTLKVSIEPSVTPSHHS